MTLISLATPPHWPILRETLEKADIVFDERSAEGRFDRLEKLAMDAVRARPDIVVVHETPALLAVRKATERIPIVMAAAFDAAAGANVTGVALDGAQLAAQVVNLVRELKPNARRIALLANADDPAGRALLGALNQAAARIRVPVGVARVRTVDDYAAAFAQWERLRLQALIVQATVDKARAAQLAQKYGLPAIGLSSGFVEAGALASFSENPRELGRKAASYVERILKGAKPAALPVEPFTRFDLALNLKTARAIEVELPDGLLARADAIIQ